MYNIRTVYHDTLMHDVSKDGSIVAKKKNVVVTSELLKEIHGWKMEGARDIDIITRLRRRTVPMNLKVGTPVMYSFTVMIMWLQL